MKPNFTAAEFIAMAKAAGHDSLHIANDPEALEALLSMAQDRCAADPSDENKARVVELQEDIARIRASFP